MLLIDDETQTYWDHTTGEAVHGPLVGSTMQVFAIQHTTVRAALIRDPALRLFRSGNVSWVGRAMGMVHRHKIDREGFIPPPFRATMLEGDDRLGEQVQGLGVVHEGRTVFFPMNTLRETAQVPWGERVLQVGRDPLDGMPFAAWHDESRPLQLFTRWYGFSRTYPECEVYSP